MWLKTQEEEEASGGQSPQVPPAPLRSEPPLQLTEVFPLSWRPVLATFLRSGEQQEQEFCQFLPRFLAVTCQID